MPIRILIADDHGVLRAGLRSLLNAEPDLKVVGEAGDGIDALRLTRELKPDIVLLDISMPELSGLLAAKKIREQVPESRVLMLTLHEDEMLLRQAIENGASGYIVKRAVEDELIGAIRAVHSGNMYVHPTMTRALFKNLAADKREKKEDPAEPLTPREIEVLTLVARGHTSRQIAGMLKLSVRTVEGHRASAMNKLGLASPIQIVRYCMEHGLID